MADEGTKMAEEKPGEQKVEVSSTVKVGEKEYTQEELSQIVGLGETARQYETQWNRKIEQFYPDYTQKSQKLADFEKAEEEKQKAELIKKEAEGNLSPEEVKRVALAQARELGIVTEEEFSTRVNKVVVDALATKDLIDDANVVVAEAVEQGLPKIELDKLFSYMQGNNPTKTIYSNPQKAYNDMFEKERQTVKETKLGSITPAPMVTQEGSMAGSKAPPPPSPITKDTLAQAIQESLTRTRGV